MEWDPETEWLGPRDQVVVGIIDSDADADQMSWLWLLRCIQNNQNNSIRHHYLN